MTSPATARCAPVAPERPYQVPDTPLVGPGDGSILLSSALAHHHPSPNQATSKSNQEPHRQARSYRYPPPNAPGGHFFENGVTAVSTAYSRPQHSSGEVCRRQDRRGRPEENPASRVRRDGRSLAQVLYCECSMVGAIGVNRVRTRTGEGCRSGRAHGKGKNSRARGGTRRSAEEASRKGRSQSEK